MEEIQQIQERNRRVEADKAWETSWMRRLCIAAITYCVAALFMWKIGASPVLLSALIPTGGYLLSTLSLGVVKNIWVNSQTKK